MSVARIVARASSRTIPARYSFSTMSVSRSAVAQQTYKAPALGVNKTYDEALKIIAQDKARRLELIKELKTKAETLLKAAPSATRTSELDALNSQIFKEEAYSEINDPEIQWKFQHGQLDMSKAVFRYMLQKQFTRETLPILYQRMTQMYVTPDLVPSFVPSLNVEMKYGDQDLATYSTSSRDAAAGRVPLSTVVTKGSLSVTTGTEEGSSSSQSTSKSSQSSSTATSSPSSSTTTSAGGYFETGVFLLPGQTIQEPTLKVTAFHPDQRLYTIVMVDPDMPDLETESYQQQLHWVLTNVPLSATQSEVTSSSGDVLLPYVPPHPPKGTKYHRYTALVCEQADEGQRRISIPKGNKNRVNRQLTTFGDLQSQYGLNVKGLTFFRQVWDKDVSTIYKDILKEQEPVYGNVPKVDELVDETGQMKKKFANL